MDIQVMVFGQLTDITGSGMIGVQDVTDTNSLVAATQGKISQTGGYKICHCRR